MKLQELGLRQLRRLGQFVRVVEKNRLSRDPDAVADVVVFVVIVVEDLNLVLSLALLGSLCSRKMKPWGQFQLQLCPF